MSPTFDNLAMYVLRPYLSVCMYSETLSTGISMTSDLIWAYTGILTAPTAPSLSNAGILICSSTE